MTRTLVTGAAGMIGSHLVDELLERGDEVVGLDNLVTGQRSNLDAAGEHPAFTFVDADVEDALAFTAIGPVDRVFHLACPPSPADFANIPESILRAGSLGTLQVAEFARTCGARLVLASTSEVYGEPLVHPQPETYWGNVNPIGPRACYDESKRFSEAVVSTFVRSSGLNAGIARIFNTYGPRMRVNDGRVVSNFVVQALRGEPLTVQGDGLQTRSFCFVTDQVRGLCCLMESGESGPFNIGNDHESTILELAQNVLELTASVSSVEHRALPQDDPTHRRPEISAARDRLGWSPSIPLRDGLLEVIAYFRDLLDADASTPQVGPRLP